jgi:hypothetical protein
MMYDQYVLEIMVETKARFGFEQSENVVVVVVMMMMIQNISEIIGNQSKLV